MATDLWWWVTVYLVLFGGISLAAAGLVLVVGGFSLVKGVIAGG